MHYVYILSLENREFYCGYTGDLKDRLRRHNQGSTKFTRDHTPDSLMFYAAFHSERTALDFEKYLKSSSGKAFRNKHLL